MIIFYKGWAFIKIAIVKIRHKTGLKVTKLGVSSNCLGVNLVNLLMSFIKWA